MALTFPGAARGCCQGDEGTQELAVTSRGSAATAGMNSLLSSSSPSPRVPRGATSAPVPVPSCPVPVPSPAVTAGTLRFWGSRRFWRDPQEGLGDPGPFGEIFRRVLEVQDRLERFPGRFQRSKRVWRDPQESFGCSGLFRGIPSRIPEVQDHLEGPPGGFWRSRTARRDTPVGLSPSCCPWWPHGCDQAHPR